MRSIKFPCMMTRSEFDGLAYTVSGMAFTPLSPISTTGISVYLRRISGRRLVCSGSWCCTTTKAIPLFPGMCLKNCSIASRPPADAPMPTNARGEASGFSGRPFCILLSSFFACVPFSSAEVFSSAMMQLVSFVPEAVPSFHSLTYIAERGMIVMLYILHAQDIECFHIKKF